MAKNKRIYTNKTLKRLFALSGNQCSFPDCSKPLVNEENAKDSNICHIEGANPGSERYRAGMTDKERNDYENLILLCVQHHDETNDVSRYTVDALKKMKADHVSKHIGEKIGNNPSMLRNAINAIAQLENKDTSDVDVNSFNIADKISHNNVKKYASLIQEYKVYYHKINSLYDELETQGSLKKDKVLRNIRSFYLKEKGLVVGDSAQPIDKIRGHADDIIDNILENLYSKLENKGSYEEDIIFGIELIMVDAFMRCKILEEPQINDSK